MYLGGHGGGQGKYILSTYEQATDSNLIIDCIKNCKADIFSVTDSCYSG